MQKNQNSSTAVLMTGNALRFVGELGFMTFMDRNL